LIMGLATGLGAAISFSLAAILYRAGLKGSPADVLLLNCLRAPFSLTVLYLGLLILKGGSLTLSSPALVYALLSAFFALILGDITFFKALKYMSVTVVYPIAYSYSLPATLFVWLLSGEKLSTGVFYSSLLVIIGIAVTYLGYPSENAGELGLKGLAYSLITSISWGASVAFTKLGLLFTDPLPFNVIRLSFLTLLLIPYSIIRRSEVRKVFKSAKYVISGGLLGIGLGPLLFFYSLGELGASKASVLTSSSPVLTALLSSVLLREKVGLRHLLGILAITAGIYLLKY